MILIGLPRQATYGSVASSGCSATAQFVARERRSRDPFEGSQVVELYGKAAFEELAKVYIECKEPGWDGYGAMPVSLATYCLARRLLEALPRGTYPPTIGAEPDGHLTLEWYRSPRRILSVSVSPEGDLHYAALLGVAKQYGTEPFFDTLPGMILDLMHRVMAAC